MTSPTTASPRPNYKVATIQQSHFICTYAIDPGGINATNSTRKRVLFPQSLFSSLKNQPCVSRKLFRHQHYRLLTKNFSSRRTCHSYATKMYTFQLHYLSRKRVFYNSRMPYRLYLRKAIRYNVIEFVSNEMSFLAGRYAPVWLNFYIHSRRIA